MQQERAKGANSYVIDFDGLDEVNSYRAMLIRQKMEKERCPPCPEPFIDKVRNFVRKNYRQVPGFKLRDTTEPDCQSYFVKYIQQLYLIQAKVKMEDSSNFSTLQILKLTPENLSSYYYKSAPSDKFESEVKEIFRTQTEEVNPNKFISFR